jgi:hypothetical protein
MSSSLVMHDLQHGSTCGHTASVFAWTDSARMSKRPPHANVSSPSLPLLVPLGMYSNRTLDVPASIEVHLPLPPSTTATTTPPSELSAMLLSPLQTENLPAGFLELKTTRLTAYYITKENFRLPTTWCAQEYAKLPRWQGGEKSMMIWNLSPDRRLRFRISSQVYTHPRLPSTTNFSTMSTCSSSRLRVRHHHRDRPMSNQKNSHDFHRLGEIYEVAGHCLLNTRRTLPYIKFLSDQKNSTWLSSPQRGS